MQKLNIIQWYIHTYITLHYITLHYITLHYITLHYITLHYITLHTYIHTYVHTYIRTYIHTYIHTYMPYHAMLCHAMPCHTIPYHTIPYHTYMLSAGDNSVDENPGSRGSLQTWKWYDRRLLPHVDDINPLLQYEPRSICMDSSWGPGVRFFHFFDGKLVQLISTLFLRHILQPEQFISQSSPVASHPNSFPGPKPNMWGFPTYLHQRQAANGAFKSSTASARSFLATKHLRAVRNSSLGMAQPTAHGNPQMLHGAVIFYLPLPQKWPSCVG